MYSKMAHRPLTLHELRDAVLMEDNFATSEGLVNAREDYDTVDLMDVCRDLLVAERSGSRKTSSLYYMGILQGALKHGKHIKAASFFPGQGRQRRRSHTGRGCKTQ